MDLISSQPTTELGQNAFAPASLGWDHLCDDVKSLILNKIPSECLLRLLLSCAPRAASSSQPSLVPPDYPVNLDVYASKQKDCVPKYINLLNSHVQNTRVVSYAGYLSESVISALLPYAQTCLVSLDVAAVDEYIVDPTNVDGLSRILRGARHLKIDVSRAYIDYLVEFSKEQTNVVLESLKLVFCLPVDMSTLPRIALGPLASVVFGLIWHCPRLTEIGVFMYTLPTCLDFTPLYADSILKSIQEENRARLLTGRPWLWPVGPLARKAALLSADGQRLTACIPEAELKLLKKAGSPLLELERRGVSRADISSFVALYPRIPISSAEECDILTDSAFVTAMNTAITYHNQAIHASVLHNSWAMRRLIKLYLQPMHLNPTVREQLANILFYRLDYRGSATAELVDVELADLISNMPHFQLERLHKIFAFTKIPLRKSAHAYYRWILSFIDQMNETNIIEYAGTVKMIACPLAFGVSQTGCTTVFELIGQATPPKVHALALLFLRVAKSSPKWKQWHQTTYREALTAIDALYAPQDLEAN